MIIVGGKKWSVKPVPGAQINWSHPLANGLISCIPLSEAGGTTIADIVTGVPLTGSALTWSYTQNGSAGVNAANNNSTFPSNTKWTRTAGVPMTMAAISQARTGANGSVRAALALETSGGTTTYTIGWSGTSTGVPVMGAQNTGGGGSAITSGSAIGVNIDTLIVGVFVSSASRQLYINGIQKATNTSAITDFAPNRIDILGNTQTLGCFGAVSIAWIWNRALTPAEILILQSDPYCMFQVQAPAERLWVPGNPFAPGQLIQQAVKRASFF